MDTKTYLKQISRLDKQIQNKVSEIYQLKTMIYSIPGFSETERVQKTSDKDMLGSTVSKIIDLERETDQLIDVFSSKRKKIIAQIDSMKNEDYYHILSMRYVGKKTFDEIATETHWSIRKVFSLHGRALQEFEKEYGKEYL